MQNISKHLFIDLYLGPDFCDVTGLGGKAGRESAPVDWSDDIASLRVECDNRYRLTRDEEFALNINKIIFRVTVLPDILGQVVYVLRRSQASIRQLNTLGLPTSMLRKLLSREIRGLVLIVGEMGAGKTSTAASLVAGWLSNNGGMGIVLEDPIETPLNGVWGKGRCMQVPVSRKGSSGCYREKIPLALRSGANILFTGEILNEETALEVVKASINGRLIVSTMHAGSTVQAIERLQTLCASLANINGVLADGLAYVIFQSITKVEVDGNGAGSKRFITRLRAQTLEVQDTAVRTQIRTGQITQLKQSQGQQETFNAWGNQKK